RGDLSAQQVVGVVNCILVPDRIDLRLSHSRANECASLTAQLRDYSAEGVVALLNGAGIRGGSGMRSTEQIPNCVILVGLNSAFVVGLLGQAICAIVLIARRMDRAVGIVANNLVDIPCGVIRRLGEIAFAIDHARAPTLFVIEELAGDVLWIDARPQIVQRTG